MLAASATLQNALKNGYALKAQPRLIVEWNQNRYQTISDVDNIPSEETTTNNLEIYPIASIATPQRPTAGIIRGRCAQSGVVNLPPGFQVWRREKAVVGEEGYTSRSYANTPDSARYYTASSNSFYKYWASPTKSGSGSPYLFSVPLVPHVIYTSNAWTNKIVVGIENTAAYPSDWTIDITTNGTTWTTVSTNPVIPTNGQVSIYRQANGTWSTTVYRDNPMQIRGVRLTVNALNKPSAFFNLIELSPRLESDLSSYLIEWSSDFDQSDVNFISPMGKCSTNTANVKLSNIDGIFNNEHSSSLYVGLIQDNVKMTLDIGYDLTDFGSATTEYIRMFTMWTENWSGQGAYEVDVELKDSSKFMQDQKAPNLYMKNVNIGEAVWRMCDAIGFNNYIYDVKTTSPLTEIPFFWSTKDENFWEVLAGIAEGTQTAIWFNQYDQLMIQTRDAAYDVTKAIDWPLQSVDQVGTKLADIIDLSETYDFEANKVNVKYKETSLSPSQNGNPIMESVWSPEDTFVLRSSPLVRDLAFNEYLMYISAKETVVWPYTGVIQLEGELIKYAGKQYAYTEKTTNLVKYAVLLSKDDKDNIDNNLSNPDVAFKNTFTGRLTITERGYLWTTAQQHYAGYITSYTSGTSRLGVYSSTSAYHHINLNESLMKISSNTTFDLNKYYVVSKGAIADPTFNFYGTRMRIPTPGNGDGNSGIAFNLGANDSGYYIELNRTEILEANGGARRRSANELDFYIRYSNGSYYRISSNGNKGQPHLIAPNTYYDIDVEFKVSGSNHLVTIFLNGIVTERITIPSAQKLTPTGRFGMFIRGINASEFEYLYATVNGNYHDDVDDVSFFDRVRGGFTGGQWDRQAIYTIMGKANNSLMRSKYSQYLKNLYKQYTFDDFGPYCHEVREMDVQFSKFPVDHSNLYFSNESQIYCPQYRSNPFGAQFMLVNASRDNAVFQGDDTLTFPGNTVGQQALVYGRLVSQKDDAQYTVQNDAGIRANGVVEVDFDNKWIQSKAAAKALGDWVVTHWAGGADQIDIEIFGNALFTVGDLVSVNYPDKDMLPSTHKYFIIGVRQSWADGLKTSLTARRARI